jgi:hypothetical protein
MKCGDSRSASKRRLRAGLLSRQMHRGDRKAAFSLLQRRRALDGIAKGGWGWRLQLANAARLRKQSYRRMLAETPSPEPDRVTTALRARFGTGAVSPGHQYRPDECRPVRPNESCATCSWRWGDREPHVIAVP